MDLSPSHNAFSRLFLNSSAGLLIGLAAAMCLANCDNGGFTQPHDPVFGLSMSAFFWLVSLIEVTVGLMCLSRASEALKLFFVLWLAIAGVVYYMLALRHDQIELSMYLGNLADAFYLTPRLVYLGLNCIIVYLLTGSSAALFLVAAQSRANSKMERAAPTL